MSYFSVLKRFISFVLLFSIISISLSSRVYAVGSDNEKEFDFECQSVLLMEAETGTILYEYNANQALPPASVTKIMTLLIVMEEIEEGNLKYSDTITTSAYASSMGGSQIYLKEGEQMSVEDMLKSVVISSANDAAVALAEHICGSEELFVKRMNQKAEELGMVNTNFENTNGLDDTSTNHVTSAKDIAIMSRELIKYENILKYSSTWMDSIRNGAFVLTNTNRLVRFYNGATGLKTGSTAKAKFCVSATAKRGNMHLICVVMGAPSSDVRNSIATELLNWGFSNFELYTNEEKDLEAIRVTSGVEDLCQIHAEKFSTVVKKGTGKSIIKEVMLPNKINAPIKADDVIGKINYYQNGDLIGSSPIYSDVDIEKIDFWTLFVRVLSKFLVK